MKYTNVAQHPKGTLRRTLASSP